MTFNMFCSTISVPKDILLIGSGFSTTLIWHINKPYIVNILVHFLLDFYNVTSYVLYRFCFSKEIGYNCLMLLTWKMHALCIIFSQTNPCKGFTCITIQKNGLKIYSRTYVVLLFWNKNACVDLLWW